MKDDLNDELNRSFSATQEIQLLSAVVGYQHMAEAGGQSREWVSDKIHELAAVIERNSPLMRQPQFGIAYVESLRRHAQKLLADPEGPWPNFEVIDGGKPDDEGPEAA